MGFFDVFKKRKSGKSIFTGDRADYHWESAAAEYCKIHGKKRGDLDDMDDAVIWEYAGNHIAFFMTWIIQNNFYNTEMFEMEEIKLLQGEKISGMDFISDYCDYQLVSEFMNEEILGFVDYYYDNNYFNDYCTFIEKEMRETVLGIRFSWDIYHQFVPVLDYTYKEYQKKN